MSGKRTWRQMTGILLFGFLCGIFYANYAGKNYVSSTGIFHEYFLNEYVNSDIPLPEYLPYLVRWRGIPVVIFLISGKIGVYKPAAITALLWIGLSGGIVLVAAVMRMGAVGIFFCMAALLPQIVFYISGWSVLLWGFYRRTESIWNKGKTAFVFLMMAAGILTEAVINPYVVGWVLKLLD